MRSVTEISATLSQLFSSTFNDDKKTLAFSDNVQDAAHRAGFFNSRTWRFSLRSAIQKYAVEKGNNLSLEDFSEGFIQYWRNKLTNEEFVSKFIAPNMTWMSAYEKMQLDGKLAHNDLATKLLGFIENRLKYEIMLEIGKKRGCIISGGRIDEEKTARTILDEFKNGKLGKITIECPFGDVS